MPVEIKDTQSTKEERTLGMKLLDKYSHSSYLLLRDYLEIETKLRELPHDEYMAKRKPYWLKYKKSDDALHEKFLDDAEALGYNLRSI
jgi:hypothetical protein